MKDKTTSLLLCSAFVTLTGFLATTAQAKEKEKAMEVKCPAGIDHSAWDRLLKKYVDEKGLVNYAAWKANKEDMEAFETYEKQFAAKADKPAEGDEKAAHL